MIKYMKEGQTMKKLPVTLASILVVLGCLLPMVVSAQQQGAERLRVLMENTTPEQRAHFEDQWMKKDLNLSTDQSARVGQINLGSAQRMQSIFNSGEGRFRMFRDVMQARDDKDEELRQVLTDDQFARYKDKKEAMWQKIHSLKKGEQ